MQKRKPKIRGLRDVQRMGSPRSLKQTITKTAPPPLQPPQPPPPPTTTIEKHQQILQRFQKFKNPTTFMFEHGEARPLTATAWPKE